MYNFLKMLQSTAEQIGDIFEAAMYEYDSIACVTLAGATSNNQPFRLRLEVDITQPDEGVETA